MAGVLMSPAIGWTAGKIMGSEGGLLRNPAPGVFGSSVGHFLAGALGITGVGLGDALISVAGACLVVAVCCRLF